MLKYDFDEFTDIFNISPSTTTLLRNHTRLEIIFLELDVAELKNTAKEKRLGTFCST